MKKRALISVSDKTGVIEFAKTLAKNGYEIISTGGTKKILAEAGVEVIGISDVTNFPEILDGRVKTLHPNVHGALLSVRDNENHLRQLNENNIGFIDVVVVNLYPFKETVAKPDVLFADAIENIDIGGPSMLRSAAKNHKFVTVICDPSDYSVIEKEMSANVGETLISSRERLAAKVFRHTASYDAAIAQYLTKQVGEENPESLTLSYDLKAVLRYGENPHQKANLYASGKESYSIVHAKQLQGKELSYNNIQDGNAAIALMKEFDKPVVVALKHMNPCGVGIGKNINEAWDNAYSSDPVSIFGGIIATNNEVTKEVALKMKEIFLEIIIAPSFSDEAIEILSTKKNLRLLVIDKGENFNPDKQIVSVAGGILYQDNDNAKISNELLNVVTNKKPSAEELESLDFAWKVVKHVKSNAIVICSGKKTVGIGAGQMNRVGAAKIALEWAKEHGYSENLVLASDAFFPFSDVVNLASEYGVKAIIQPGGSIKDEDSIKACNDLGITMAFTGIRHFKH